MICPITEEECSSDKCTEKWLGNVPVYDCKLSQPGAKHSAEPKPPKSAELEKPSFRFTIELHEKYLGTCVMRVRMRMEIGKDRYFEKDGDLTIEELFCEGLLQRFVNRGGNELIEHIKREADRAGDDLDSMIKGWREAE